MLQERVMLGTWDVNDMNTISYQVGAALLPPTFLLKMVTWITIINQLLLLTIKQDMAFI